MGRNMKTKIALFMIFILIFTLSSCFVENDIELTHYYAKKTEDYAGSLRFFGEKEMNPYILIEEDNEISISRGNALSFRYSGKYEYNGQTLFFKHQNGSSITLKYKDRKFEVVTATDDFLDFQNLIFVIE